mmetsp:Transcript_74058/g.176592  ORF Transcript_74058/g.176592 Transcript_74058/m.176592 type:complete len:333 (+) Transcript_74058:1346-2344(+)
MILLFAQGLHLDFQVLPTSLQGVNGLGLRGELHPDLAAGLVQQVHRLVRQKPGGDVAVRELSCRHQRGVLDAHPVVRRITLLEPSQDSNGRLHRRLVHEHLLKSTLQGGILLNVLAVLVHGGGPNTAQLPPCQHGLQEVCCVHGPVGLASTDQQVRLVDEEHDTALGIFDLLKHCLEPLLELSAVLGAADQGPNVQRDHAAGLQSLRHVSDDHTLREALHDSRLPHTWIPHEDGVVLGAPCQHLHHPPDLLVPADHRVQAPVLGIRHEVTPVLGERLKVLVPRLAVHFLGASQVLHRLLHQRDAVARRAQDLLDCFLLQQGQEEIWQAHVAA